VARVRLVSAVDRYDPCRANPFIAHAIACINGELRRCLGDTSWRLHASPTLKGLALRVAKACEAIRWVPDPSRPTLHQRPLGRRRRPWTRPSRKASSTSRDRSSRSAGRLVGSTTHTRVVRPARTAASWRASTSRRPMPRPW
jgi:hypothetical protein